MANGLFKRLLGGSDLAATEAYERRTIALGSDRPEGVSVDQMKRVLRCVKRAGLKHRVLEQTSASWVCEVEGFTSQMNAFVADLAAEHEREGYSTRPLP